MYFSVYIDDICNIIRYSNTKFGWRRYRVDKYLYKRKISDEKKGNSELGGHGFRLFKIFFFFLL